MGQELDRRTHEPRSIRAPDHRRPLQREGAPCMAGDRHDPEGDAAQARHRLRCAPEARGARARAGREQVGHRRAAALEPVLPAVLRPPLHAHASRYRKWAPSSPTPQRGPESPLRPGPQCGPGGSRCWTRSGSRSWTYGSTSWTQERRTSRNHYFRTSTRTSRRERLKGERPGDPHPRRPPLHEAAPQRRGVPPLPSARHRRRRHCWSARAPHQLWRDAPRCPRPAA